MKTQDQKDREFRKGLINLCLQNGIKPHELEEYIYHYKRMKDIIQKALDRKYIKELEESPPSN